MIPLLTTLDEVTVKPNELVEEASPWERAVDASDTLEAEAVGGVAVPTKITEPDLMEAKVMASTWSALMLRIWSRALTIESIILRTSAVLLALRVKLKPTLISLWHFHPFLV
jgi:hypothetical protein